MEVSRGNHSLWQGGRGTESPEMQKTTPFSPVCWGERRFAVPPGLLLVCVLLSQDMRHVSMEARELSFPMPSAAAFHQTAALFGRCAGYSSPSSPVYTMIISRGAFVKLNPPQTKPFSLDTETRDFFFLGGGLSFEKERPPPNLPQRNQHWGSRLFAMGSAAARVSGHGPPLKKEKGPRTPPKRNQYWGSRLFAMGSAAARVSGHGTL